MSTKTQLGVFAKYWQPGRVKTRLAATVGDRLAAEFHFASLTSLLNEFGDFPAVRVLAFAPRDRRAEFLSVAGDCWQLQPQADGDLGQRMRIYFQNAFKSGLTRVVLIGSDSPQLRQTTVHSALEAIEEVSVALGPCEDGGYYLIAGRPDMPDIFGGIDWSTPRVWDQTVAQLEAQRASWRVLNRELDVDDLAAVIKLARQLDSCERYGELRVILERCIEASDSMTP